MSQLLVQKYLNDLADLRKASGTNRESVVREAFKTLLKDWGKSEGLLFISEYGHKTVMDEDLPKLISGELRVKDAEGIVGGWA
ncbi:MAG: hypothetical protein WCA78_06680 [Rhizomicrobium sp.]